MPVRINKVYTRTGDDGTTALIGGKRVGKNHPRVEAFGCVDELNAAVGLGRSALASDRDLPVRDRKDFEGRLRIIQNRLFDLGCVLAAPDGKTWKGMPLPSAKEISDLERSMDAMQKSLPPLNSFVLPGGSWPNAWLHQCRVLCRRAERRVVSLAKSESVPPEALCYLNRLSDWFFTAARFAASRCGTPEFLWEYGLKPAPKRPRPAP